MNILSTKMKLIKKIKYFKKGINMNRKKILKVRIKFISVLFSCCIAIIIARLYYIQLGNKSDQYVSIALNQYNFQYKTSNLNYKVLDDSNENLINYKTKYIVEIKSNIFKNFNNNIEMEKIFIGQFNMGHNVRAEAPEYLLQRIRKRLF